jgi:hypothetical protein
LERFSASGLEIQPGGIVIVIIGAAFVTMAPILPTEGAGMQDTGYKILFVLAVSLVGAIVGGALALFLPVSFPRGFATGYVAGVAIAFVAIALGTFFRQLR